jgi:tRNA pseudouridine38-40 synthase
VRLKLTLEYDGTGFRGWAAQPGLRTGEGVMAEALGRVYPSVEALAVAGRTDTGVHALAQVASVEIDGGPPTVRAPEALNAVLPDDLSVSAAEEVAPDFHARHSARARSYRYRVYRRRAPSPFETRRSWWYPRPIAEEQLAESAELLLGEHDFRAFTPTETQHQVFLRTVESAVWQWQREVDAVYGPTALVHVAQGPSFWGSVQLKSRMQVRTPEVAR